MECADSNAISDGPPPTCTPTSATPTITKDCAKDGEMPPVVITVDFGDGSGEQKWDRDSPHDVWTHKYSQPGMYTIFVMSKLIVIFDKFKKEYLLLNEMM